MGQDVRHLQEFKKLKPYRDFQRNRQLETRVAVLRGLIAAALALQVAVFWYLQVVRGPEFREKAEDNRMQRRVVRALRGPLVDQSGIVMATNQPTFAVYLAPERTREPEREVRRLAEVVGEDPAALLAQLEKARRVQPRFQPVLLLADVGLETAARIEARRSELRAIDVEMAAKRKYLLAEAAAHVLGYVGEASEAELAERTELLMGDRVGRSGAERTYDRELRGRAGIRLEEVNASGRPLGLFEWQRPPVPGRALRTTLDAELQRDLVDAFGDSLGAAVFLDPMTGGVRALYSAPSYDPNVFGGRLSPTTWNALVKDPDKPLQNRAVQSAYNPGSTFKVVMAAAALEEGVVSPSDRLGCGGSGNFYGRSFLCWKKGGHGGIGVQDAITQSCNVFFYNMGKRLGADRLYKWARAFGLDQPSGLRFDHESRGLIGNQEWSQRVRKQPIYPGEVISMSIGQGLVTMTPIQNAVVAAAIANGGYRVHPHLVDRPGEVADPEPIGLKPETIAVVRAGMVNVVESGSGTARRARVPGYVMAGKTGTAQTISREADPNAKDNAWFMGFGPVDNPQLAWGIIVERGGHGGEAAAPIAGIVVRRYLERVAAKQKGNLAEVLKQQAAESEALREAHRKAREEAATKPAAPAPRAFPNAPRAAAARVR